MLRQLSAIARIATRPSASVSDIVETCALVRSLLDAEDAYVIRAGDPHFVQLGSDADPREYEIKQRGYFLAWKELAANPAQPASLLRAQDRLVSALTPLAPGSPATHIAAILPASESNSEMLIVRGPWPDGLTEAHIEQLIAIRPLMAYLVGNVLDSERHERQRSQLRALADVAEALSRADSIETGLNSLATALARASGFDWVTIALFDPELRTVVQRAINLSRHSTTETASRGLAGAETETDSTERDISTAKSMMRDGQPWLAPDVFDPSAGITDPSMLAYWERAHVISLACYPIIFKGRLLGMISFCGSTRHSLDQSEAELLGTLVSQAATAIDGLRLNRELHETNEQLRAVFASAPLLITVFDPDGVVRLSEGAAFTMSEHQRARTVGKHVTEVIPGPLGEQVHSWVRASLEGDPPSPALRLGDRDFETKWATLRDDHGEVTGALAIALDVTDRVGAQRELQAVNEQLQEARDRAVELAQRAEASARVKSEFIANTSHEIRTPMNGVIGVTSLLLDTTLHPEQREYVETIRDSADALLRVIDDILDFSRLEAGKMTVEVVDMDLRSVMEDIADLLAPSAQKKGLEFVLSLIPPDFPSLFRGDPGRLRQVLLNLTGNAIKFTQQGEVCMSATVVREDPQAVTLRFSVTDTGIGIPYERQAAIFEAFTQADGTSTRSFGGTGLGLTISRQIIEVMGGTIGVESTPGGGSSFWFELRLDRQARQPERFAPFAAGAAVAPVLVVDDNATNRMILRHQLESWGLATAEASSGQEALDLLRTGQTEFSAVLMDMQMPLMDGASTTAAIQAEPATAELPVILLSSSGPVSAGELALMGFTAGLTKPVRQSQLYNTLIDALHIAPASAPSTPPSPRPADRAVVPLRLSVLVAEDNAINQKVARRMLERWECEVHIVETGVEALQAVSDGAYDLLLLDCHMPIMDGYEACRTLRAREQASGTHLPVIAMTANAMSGDREQCLAAGMDDYVRKPVKPEELYGAIARLVATPAAAAAQPEPATDPVLDLDDLRQAAGGDESLALELLKEFLATAPGIFEPLLEALEEADLRAARLAAHNLKGSAWAIGAHALGAALQRIEDATASGSPPPLALSAAAADQYASLTSLLQDYVRRQAA